MSIGQLLRGVLVAPGRRAVGDMPIPAAAFSAVPDGAGVNGLRHDAPFERGYEQGHAQGLADGLAQGLVDAQTQIAERTRHVVLAAEADARRAEEKRASEHHQRLAALDEMLGSVERSRARRVQALEFDAVELAFEALCRLMSPGPENTSQLAEVIRHGLDRLRERKSMTVRLHPSDLAAMSHDTQARLLLVRHGHVAWTADAALAPGDCRIDTERGSLHAGPHAQLERLKEVWLHHASAHEMAQGAGESDDAA